MGIVAEVKGWSVEYTATMYELLDGKVAVVTGGASGIGRAIAYRFAQANADGVVVADIREKPRGADGPATHELIQKETDAEARYVECDVSEYTDIETVLDTALDMGGLDVLVNNAGIIGPNGPIEEADIDEYQRLMSVNLDGVFYGCKEAASRMGEGSIINISSIAGIRGYGTLSPYCAAKGGIKLMTFALAAELGPRNIRVNSIHPGVIETEMVVEDVPIIGSGDQEEQWKLSVPLRRFGQPEEIADAAVYLASDMSSYVTGEALIVDGGASNSA